MLEPATAAISSYSWTSAGVAGMLLTLCWHCCSYSVACWNRRACAFQNGQRLRWMEKHKRQAEKRPDEANKESEMGLKIKGGRKLVLCHIVGCRCSHNSWIRGNKHKWRLSPVSPAGRRSQTLRWHLDRPQTHVQNTAIKESVVKLSLSKLFNLSPRGEQRKTQCCARQDYSAQCSCGWVKGSL